MRRRCNAPGTWTVFDGGSQLTGVDTPTPRSDRLRARRSTLSSLVGASLLLALAGCGAQTTAVPAGEQPSLTDGIHQGWLISIDQQAITLELARFLSGEEALAAAEADGEEVEGALPDGFYVDELDERVSLSLSEELSVQLIDCTEACLPVDVALDDLVDGTVRPYNGDRALVEVAIEDGTVRTLTELYLP
jgi:hypothetical protein